MTDWVTSSIAIGSCAAEISTVEATMNGQFVPTYCLCWTRMDSNSSFGRLLAQPATQPASLISSSVTRFRHVSHKSLFTRHMCPIMT